MAIYELAALSCRLLTVQTRHLTAQGSSAGPSTNYTYNQPYNTHQQEHKTQVRGTINIIKKFRNYLYIYLFPFLVTPKLASLLDTFITSVLGLDSIMSASPITTHGQFYEACKAFPDNQWISVLAAFTTIVAGSPSHDKVQSNFLAQPNPMHLFAYVTASGYVTTIHRFSRMTTRMGQSTTQ